MKTDVLEISSVFDGARLYGYLRDNGQPHNLVLIPGSGAHHSIWEPVFDGLELEANLFCVELPGFGKSEPRMPDGTIEIFTSMVLQLVDAAGIDRFFVGGHSIGGMMAIEMIDHAAERLDGVVSCEGWTHASVSRNAFNGLKNETLTPEQLEKRRYFGQLAREGWTEREWRRFVRIWCKWEKGRMLLERTELPVLEIWGDRGMDNKPDRDLLQIPAKDNITLEWLENGGHSFLVQYPRLVGRIITGFINDWKRERELNYD